MTAQADSWPRSLEVARLALHQRVPYLGSAIWSLRARPSYLVQTCAVSIDWILYWSPEFVASLNLEEAVAVLYHELNHLLLEHAKRIGLREHAPWNLAADAEINGALRAEGYTLPPDGIYPESFNLPSGLLAEQYFSAGEDRAQKPEPEPDSEPGQEDGDQGEPEPEPEPGQEGEGEPTENSQEGEGGKPSADGQQDGDSTSGEPGESQGQGKPSPQTSPGGSGSDGIQRAWEDAPQSEGVSPGEREAILDQVAQRIAEDVAKGRGDIPGRLARLAESRLAPPRIPWQRLLSAAVRAASGWASGAVDYTRSRPNRRQSAYGRVVMPSLRRPTPELAVVLDTSGSMSGAELDAGLAEIGGILTATGLSRGAQVISCDAEITAARRVFKAAQVSVSGGGGTDMRVGIDAALALKPRPHIVIVVTDGGTPWPSVEPKGCKLICCLTELGDDTAPPWVRTIRIKP